MTRRPIPLRRRVTVGFTVLGFVLSLVFAGAVVFMAEDYETILVDEILRGQAEDYSSRLVHDADTPLPRTHRLSGYRMDRNGKGDVPAEFAWLAPGIHESGKASEAGIHIGVFDTRVGRLVFVIDLSDIERGEQHLSWFLIATIVLGTMFAGWLGWLLAGRAIAPVRLLAAAVDAMPTTPRPSALADSASDDEVGQLAAAIDHYQARMVDADAREQAFFADASHELRTPIAVVRGATEVLLDEPVASAGMRQRLQRLDRGMQELTDLLDVLLGLARRREPQFETIDARTLLHEAATSITATGGDIRSIRVEIQAEGRLRLPPRESLLLLRGVLRGLLPPVANGILSMRLQGTLLELEFTGSTSTQSMRTWPRMERSDRGHGLTLIERLAERLDWAIEDPGTDVLRLRLPDGAFVA